jgi:hypothetical protein
MLGGIIQERYVTHTHTYTHILIYTHLGWIMQCIPRLQIADTYTHSLTHTHTHTRTWVGTCSELRASRLLTRASKVGAFARVTHAITRQTSARGAWAFENVCVCVCMCVCVVCVVCVCVMSSSVSVCACACVRERECVRVSISVQV